MGVGTIGRGPGAGLDRRFALADVPVVLLNGRGEFRRQPVAQGLADQVALPRGEVEKQAFACGLLEPPLALGQGSVGEAVAFAPGIGPLLLALLGLLCSRLLASLGTLRRRGWALLAGGGQRLLPGSDLGLAHLRQRVIERLEGLFQLSSGLLLRLAGGLGSALGQLLLGLLELPAGAIELGLDGLGRLGLGLPDGCPRPLAGLQRAEDLLCGFHQKPLAFR